MKQHMGAVGTSRRTWSQLLQISYVCFARAQRSLKEYTVCSCPSPCSGRCLMGVSVSMFVLFNFVTAQKINFLVVFFFYWIAHQLFTTVPAQIACEIALLLFPRVAKLRFGKRVINFFKTTGNLGALKRDISKLGAGHRSFTFWNVWISF